jgi:hypothetical protein
MPKSPGIMQLLKATLGAFIGVQSEQQRQLDFQSTTIWPYLIAGVFAVAAFVATLLVLVSWILAD